MIASIWPQFDCGLADVKFMKRLHITYSKIEVSLSLSPPRKLLADVDCGTLGNSPSNVWTPFLLSRGDSRTMNLDADGRSRDNAWLHNSTRLHSTRPPFWTFKGTIWLLGRIGINLTLGSPFVGVTWIWNFSTLKRTKCFTQKKKNPLKRTKKWARRTGTLGLGLGLEELERASRRPRGDSKEGACTAGEGTGRGKPHAHGCDKNGAAAHAVDIESGAGFIGLFF